MIQPRNRSRAKIINNTSRLELLKRYTREGDGSTGEESFKRGKAGLRDSARGLRELHGREKTKTKKADPRKNTQGSIKEDLKRMKDRETTSTATKKAIPQTATGQTTSVQAKANVSKINKLARKPTKAGQAQKTVKKAKKAKERAQNAVRAVVRTVKAAANAIAGSSLAAPAAVLAAAVILFMLIGSLISAIPTFTISISLKSEDWELSKTYAYITELDVEVEETMKKAAEKKPGYDEYEYYLNGQPSSRDVPVKTDADVILAYLDAKYDDYTLDGILRLFGTKVRSEIKDLHQKLYQVTYKTRTRQVPGDKDNPPYTVRILEVRLQAREAEDYIEKDASLKPDEREKYELLMEVGVYTTKQELGDPFPGAAWKESISARYGWRFHPLTGEKQMHQGIDIALPQGTPIYAVLYGAVKTVTYDDSRGNVVEIESPDQKKTVLYAHCSGITAKPGQFVGQEDVIAYVGDSGQTTGPHLHIEVEKEGHKLNPIFFLRGKKKEGD